MQIPEKGGCPASAEPSRPAPLQTHCVLLYFTLTGFFIISSRAASQLSLNAAALS